MTSGVFPQQSSPASNNNEGLTPSVIKSQTLLVSYKEQDESILSWRTPWTEPTALALPYFCTSIKFYQRWKCTTHLQSGLKSSAGHWVWLTQPPVSTKSLSTVLICQGPSVKPNCRIQQFLMPYITMILFFLNSITELSEEEPNLLPLYRKIFQ